EIEVDGGYHLGYSSGNHTEVGPRTSRICHRPNRAKEEQRPDDCGHERCDEALLGLPPHVTVVVEDHASVQCRYPLNVPRLYLGLLAGGGRKCLEGLALGSDSRERAPPPADGRLRPTAPVRGSVHDPPPERSLCRRTSSSASG